MIPGYGALSADTGRCPGIWRVISGYGPYLWIRGVVRGYGPEAVPARGREPLKWHLRSRSFQARRAGRMQPGAAAPATEPDFSPSPGRAAAAPAPSSPRAEPSALL